MSRQSRIERLWQPALSPLQWFLWVMLALLSVVYSSLLQARAAWWRRRAQSAPVMIISIGNLTVGGNGKTPFTLYLANLLSSRGYRIGIVSRGYGRRSTRRNAILVADQGKLLIDVAASGDEPAMMAHSFNGPITVAKRRIDGVRLLLTQQPVDVILFDDAFQHLRLRRDLDFVLVARTGFGNGWLLPAGPLREPLTALRRADALIAVGAEDDAHSLSLHSALAAVGASPPVLRIRPRPEVLVKSEDGRWIEKLLALNNQRVLAVCGLADSSGFTEMLGKLGAEIVELMEFPDHHNYDDSDWRRILAAAAGADLMITTEKDLVKLERFSPVIESMYALRLIIDASADIEARLLQIISDKLGHRATYNLKEVPRQSKN